MVIFFLSRKALFSLANIPIGSNPNDFERYLSA
jgi:hypothetical protein